MNKTKEQILEPFEFKSAGKVNTKDALKAMDEYTKQEAIAFASWILQNAVIAEDDYYFIALSNMGQVTEEELYQQYLIQKQS